MDDCQYPPPSMHTINSDLPDQGQLTPDTAAPSTANFVICNENAGHDGLRRRPGPHRPLLGLPVGFDTHIRPHVCRSRTVGLNHSTTPPDRMPLVQC